MYFGMEKIRMNNIRVYYLVRNDKTNKNDLGFFNKFYGQIDTIIKNKCDLTFIYFEKKCLTGEYFEDSRSDKFEITNFTSFFFKNILFYGKISSLFRDSPPDIVYLRYKISDITFILFLRKVKKLYPNCRVFIEFPTFPYDLNWQQESLLKKVLLPVDKYFRKKLKDYVDYTVTYTSQEKIYGIDAINIENGVSFKKLAVKKKKNYSGDEFKLIAVAGLGYWHGYDRIIRGIHEYKLNNKDAKVSFYVVGDGKEKNNLMQLTHELNLDESVIFYGARTDEDLDDIFEDAHVAVSTVGWHRMGITKSSTLKSREYCARGIPFIMEGDDDGFSKNFPFTYKVSADETPVNIGDIIRFFKSLEKSDYSNLMRQYAEDNFSWNKKFVPVINKFK